VKHPVEKKAIAFIARQPLYYVLFTKNLPPHTFPSKLLMCHPPRHFHRTYSRASFLCAIRTDASTAHIRRPKSQ